MDRYIREEPLAAHPLHDRQHHIRWVNLASLLDVDGAFNHTTKESIVKGAEDHLVPNTVSRWLWHKLSSRRVEAYWGSHSEEVKVGRAVRKEVFCLPHCGA